MPELTAIAATTDAQTIRNLAESEAARERLVIDDDGYRIGYILQGDQHLEQIDLEQYADEPRAKRGTVAVADADSLVAYVSRHRDQATTTLWANIDAGTITAVLDDHAQGAATANWGRHRTTLTLKATEDWKHWTKADGQLLPQARFAEHIEDGVDAIRDPDAATMLEVAQTFHAKNGVDFKSAQRLGGDIDFAYQETSTAKAGQNGKMDVPQMLTLGLAPFDGNDLYEVKARIRFRLTDGNLGIGYRLIRPDKIRRAAFDDVVKAVAGGLDLPVMAGTPRTSWTV